MYPLISVIVPVYNVENYLRKCLESIINQTYKNLEIILIDDGSTDNSGKICDEYAAKDNRIKLIHKPNGGLSDARNAGLEIAKGEYIGFVDSDDWLELNAYEIMLGAIFKNDFDIAICGYVVEFKNKKIMRALDSNTLIGNEKILNTLFYNKNFPNAVWCKLYKREIFRKLRFPVGKIYEDMLIKFDILKNSTKIIIISEILYHYRQRENSIMHHVNIDKSIEKINVCKDIIKKVQNENKTVELAAYAQLYKHYVYMIDDILTLKFSKIEEQKMIREISNEIRKNFKNILLNKNISHKAKIGYILLSIDWKLFVFIRKIIDK